MIRVLMKNFKCHQYKEVHFKNAFTILKGNTGSGKSTVLEAIYYALYGDIKKPYTFGATTCCVELDILDLKIIRTSRPNRLQVLYDGIDYEDASAQAIIDKNFMNMHEFIASSYIRQRSNNSLIAMTPAEQVQFIKNIAFDTNVNEKIKEKIKELIKETNLELERQRSSVKFIEERIVELEKEEFEVLENPLKIDEGKFEKDLENLKSILTNLKIQKKKLQDEYDDKSVLYSKNLELCSRRDRFIEDVNDLHDKIDSLGKPSTDETLDKMENALEKLKQDREIYFAYDIYLEEEMIFDEECDEYFELQKERLKKLKEELLSTEQVEEYKNTLQKYHIYKSARNKVTDILSNLETDERTFIEQVDNAILSLKQKATVKVLKCPTCKTSLCLEEGSLRECFTKSKKGDEDVDKTLDVLLKNYELIFEEIEDPSPILNKNEICKKSVEDVREILKTRKLPNHLEKTKQKVESLRIEEPEGDFLELDKKIKKYEKHLSDQWKLKSEINNLEAILSKKRKILDEILQSTTDLVDVKVVKDLEKKLREVDDQLNKSQERYEAFLKMQNDFTKYKEYVKHKEEVLKNSEKLKELKKVLNGYELKYNALLTLRETSNKAEILALEAIIENINEYAKDYLNLLFPDEPIVVRLENYKEVKKDIKCKMNVVIQYKGSQYDNADQLSGGERQKVEMAFELAVNNLLNSKILMLDECINNLDKEMNEEILAFLSEHARVTKKLIIVVSHEATQGGFENEIDMSK